MTVNAQRMGVKCGAGGVTGEGVGKRGGEGSEGRGGGG